MGAVKDGRLLLRWSKKERDLFVSFPRKQDGGLLFMMLNEHPWEKHTGFAANDPEKWITYLQELERRGYDMTTLRITIDKKRA
jgi:hypothetical protein